MASPSAKQLLTGVFDEPDPDSPRARGLLAGVLEEAASSSPRARSLLTTVQTDVPPSPRARVLLSSALEDFAPTSPRARVALPTVHAEPVRLWPVQPNWTSPVVERLAWNTDVITARDGSEQRIGLRTRPVRTFDYQFLLTHAQLGHVQAIVRAWQDQALEVPIWTDVQLLSESIEAGARLVPCNYAMLDFEAGGRAAILAPDYASADYGVHDTWYEVFDVDDLDTGGLAVDAGLVRAWPRGSWIVPVREGFLSETFTWVRQTAEGGTGTASLRLTDPGYPDLAGLLTPDQYRSLDVLPWRANRGEDLTENFQRLQARIESVGGRLQVSQRVDRPSLGRGPVFVFEGRQAVLELRAWLDLREGRRAPYYASSGCRDMDLVFPAAADHDSLLVKSVRGDQLYGRPHGPHTLAAYRNRGVEDLEIRERAGADPIRRRVLEWADAGEGFDQVLLDEAIGVALTPGREVLSLLERVRQESDTAELRWSTDQLVNVTLTTRSA